MAPSNAREPKIPLDPASCDPIYGTMAFNQSHEKVSINRRQSQISLSQRSINHPSQQEEKPVGSDSRITSSGAPTINSNVPSQGVSPQSIANATPSSAGTGTTGKSIGGPSVINKQLLSKLNKSLKERLKTTSIREPQTKTPTLIQSVLSTSPQFSAGSNIQNSVSNPAIDQTSTLRAAPLDEHLKSDLSDGDILAATACVQGKESALKFKAKSKRKASKANSSRTDFFAAKLASAVDDVDSSDSDETFVYETNVHEFGSDADDIPAASTSTNVTPPGVPRDPKNGEIHHVENINAPARARSVLENISVPSSLKNDAIDYISHSPRIGRRVDEEKDWGSKIRAESVHSFQLKTNNRNCFHVTPPTTTMSGKSQNPLSLAPSHENHTFSDPYMDTRPRYSRNGMRKNSSYSLLSDEQKDRLSRSPQSPYCGQRPPINPISFGLSDNHQHVGKPSHDGLSAYDEEEVSEDEPSSHGDLNSICTEPNAQGSYVPNEIKGGYNFVPACKSNSDKTTTTSSKLRSTTSKLFDKKGAQPRRYSTIPDDIDIEDFDDELIYYDNNSMRFPYNNQASMNESSSLLNGHKLPHHRSLNLNFTGKRASARPRNTRYVSLGYVPSGNYSNMKRKSEIFPFPYPENNQQNFYGFDEYDEDSQLQPEQDSIHMKGRSGQSLESTRYLLPRKDSTEHAERDKFAIVKNVIYTLIGIICILSVGFVSGFLLASTKELSNVSILSINHATVSQDELIFNVVVEALNPGWFTVSLEELELDIFAKSGYLKDLSGGASMETVLLGSVSSFESALTYRGNFLSRQVVQQTGEIKLISPGKNSTGFTTPEPLHPPSEPRDTIEPQNSPNNSDKWAVISKHPFDLILRGVIKYNLPWSRNEKSVVVDNVGYIDPSYVL